MSNRRRHQGDVAFPHSSRLAGIGRRTPQRIMAVQNPFGNSRGAGGIHQELDVTRIDLRSFKLFGIPFLDKLSVAQRSEEHTSELQSLMRISYAVFCLKKKKTHKQDND